jgi:hypothetical protein
MDNPRATTSTKIIRTVDSLNVFHHRFMVSLLSTRMEEV